MTVQVFFFFFFCYVSKPKSDFRVSGKLCIKTSSLLEQMISKMAATDKKIELGDTLLKSPKINITDILLTIGRQQTGIW